MDYEKYEKYEKYNNALIHLRLLVDDAPETCRIIANAGVKHYGKKIDDLNEKIQRDLNVIIERETEGCNKIDDFDVRLRCKSDLLYSVTKIQDFVNLDIMGDFRETDSRCSEDERWVPVHMADNANAVILGIARNKFRPDAIKNEGYVEEKLNSLDSKRYMVGV